MIIQQRVMAARFAEKARRNPEFAKQLGVEVFYAKEKMDLGGKKDEKDNTYRGDATDGDPDVEGDNFH